jgi:ACS family hexuronate transporter-like MFS transporter
MKVRLLLCRSTRIAATISSGHLKPDPKRVNAMSEKIQIPGLRWYIVAMLCISTQINYLDRQTLSILAHTITAELNLTMIEYSRITSAFLVSYTIMYAVSGLLIDRIGVRRSLIVFATGWSIANILHAFARTAMQFSVFRFLLGATEPANFPAGIKAVSEWFPLRERALAVGIFNGGAAIGSAIAAPLISFIALSWGWRYAFVFGGLLGLIWVITFAIFYRTPRLHPWLSSKELSFIESDPISPQAGQKLSIGRLLRIRSVWGCIVVRMLLDPISYFFIFWTPLFLQQERGFDLADIGKYSGIPFVALALGNVAGGLIPRSLVGRGWSLNRSRKSVMLTVSLLMPVCCLLITQVTTPSVAITLISAAMFCHGAWAFMALPAEVFPKEHVGTITGFAGAMGGLTGIITQQIIGWTVQNASFAPIFIVCAFIYIIAFVTVSLLIGKLGEIRDLSPAAV